MGKDESPWVPRWTVLATLMSAVLSILAYSFGVPYGNYALAVTVVGVTYILYKWGQYREKPSKYSDDPEKKSREMEQKGRGFGGNQ